MMQQFLPRGGAYRLDLSGRSLIHLNFGSAQNNNIVSVIWKFSCTIAGARQLTGRLHFATLLQPVVKCKRHIFTAAYGELGQTDINSSETKHNATNKLYELDYCETPTVTKTL